MPDRITRKDLERRVSLINTLLERPQAPYTGHHDGSYVANPGNIHLSGAYGGFAVHEMCPSGGVDNLSNGHAPARECYTFLGGMIVGLRAAGK